MEVVMMAEAPTKQAYYQQFLAGLILAILAGSATVWYFTGIWFSLAYSAGAASVLIFTKVAPTYQPDADTEEERERGFH